MQRFQHLLYAMRLCARDFDFFSMVFENYVCKTMSKGLFLFKVYFIIL